VKSIKDASNPSPYMTLNKLQRVGIYGLTRLSKHMVLGRMLRKLVFTKRKWR